MIVKSIEICLNVTLSNQHSVIKVNDIILLVLVKLIEIKFVLLTVYYV
jgi:hypothetical protein